MPTSFENYVSKKHIWRKKPIVVHIQLAMQAQFENYAISNKKMKNTTTYIDEYIFASPNMTKTGDGVLLGLSISTTFAKTSFL